MKKRKNKGFTLVEAVVAFAVLGIAVFGIGGFFVSAARSYSSVSDETSLQYEAQLALNQMENMLIDSNLGVSYNCVVDDVNKFVEKDSEVTAGPIDYKVLYAFNAAENDKLEVMLLKWVDKDDAIYYKELEITVGNDEILASSIDVSGTTISAGWDLLAEDVTEFAVDLSTYQQTQKVNLNLGFENRSKDYKTAGTVLLRNDVLINEENIKEIYQRVAKGKKAVINGVEIVASNDVAVPGSTIELTTNVTSSNDVVNTNQEITQWIVKAGSNVLFDSLVVYSENPVSNIVTNETNIRKHTLTVGADAASYTVLTVEAIVVDGGNTFTNSVQISVKVINNIKVTAKADKSFVGNANLQEVIGTTTWADQRTDSTKIPKMELRPNNIVLMSGEVTASSMSAQEKELRWSLVDKPNDVIATIDNTGKLMISPYSAVGEFKVRATLMMDSNIYVDYRVEIKSQYDENTANLQITADKTSINRGGSLSCSLTLDNVEVDNKDYDWIASVTSSNGKEITGTSVVINEGNVYVGYDLSFDYDYLITITAKLKSNPKIEDSVDFRVPKVALQISPSVMYAEMGDVVSGITCTATGLEDYDIRWSMAKALNPKYFFTASGNFHIIGSKNEAGAGVASVVMGNAAKDPQTSCTVKAYLKDYANYNVTMPIYTTVPEIVINIKDGKESVRRGGSLDFDVALKESLPGITVTDSDVTWTVSAKDGNTTVSTNGLSISKEGVLTVDNSFASNKIGKDIVATITATPNNPSIEPAYKNVTIKAEKLDATYISPQNILIPDGENANGLVYTYTDEDMTDIEWSVTKPSDMNNSYKKITDIGKTTGTIVASKNESTTSDNGAYTITAKKGSLTPVSTQLRYGLEYFTSGYTRIKYTSYSVRKSTYSYLNSSGEMCPVYYVKYSSTYYAFVSYSTNAQVGNGKWYKYGSSKWTESSKPSGWNYQYFK